LDVDESCIVGERRIAVLFAKRAIALTLRTILAMSANLVFIRDASSRDVNVRRASMSLYHLTHLHLLFSQLSLSTKKK
jgi:hypothetical protein